METPNEHIHRGIYRFQLWTFQSWRLKFSALFMYCLPQEDKFQELKNWSRIVPGDWNLLQPFSLAMAPNLSQHMIVQKWPCCFINQLSNRTILDEDDLLAFRIRQYFEKGAQVKYYFSICFCRETNDHERSTLSDCPDQRLGSVGFESCKGTRNYRIINRLLRQLQNPASFSCASASLWFKFTLLQSLCYFCSELREEGELSLIQCYPIRITVVFAVRIFSTSLFFHLVFSVSKK